MSDPINKITNISFIGGMSLNRIKDIKFFDKKDSKMPPVDERKSKVTKNTPKIPHKEPIDSMPDRFGLDDLSHDLYIGSKVLTNDNMTNVMKDLFDRIVHNEELNVNKPEFISFKRINNYISYTFKFNNENAWNVFNNDKEAMEKYLLEKARENFSGSILDAEINIRKGSLEIEIIVKVISFTTKIMKLTADFLKLYSDTDDYIKNGGKKSSIIKSTINIISSILSIFFEEPIVN